MAWGQREKRLAKLYRRDMDRGMVPKDLPKAVMDAPSLAPGLELYWLAYSELSTCRPPGFAGLSNIPWTALDAYARRHEFSSDQFEWLVFITRRMDNVMQEWQEKQSGNG